MKATTQYIMLAFIAGLCCPHMSNTGCYFGLVTNQTVHVQVRPASMCAASAELCSWILIACMVCACRVD